MIPADNSQSPKPIDELSVGMGDKTLSIRGGDTIVIVIVLALAIFTGWILWDNSNSSHDRLASLMIESHSNQNKVEHIAIKEAIEAQTDVLKDQKQLQEEQNYMLFFATPSEKKRLRDRIHRPPRFRELLREEIP